MKFLGAQVTVTTANDINGAVRVRVLNDSGATVTVTQKDSGGTTIATVTILNNGVEYFHKNGSDTLESTGAVKVNAVAARDWT